MARNIFMKVPAIPVVQPLGIFYLCSIDSDLLKKLAYPDTLAISGVDMNSRGIYKLSGNQREEVTNKREEIGRFIDSMEASFPNTIIIGANVDEHGLPVEDINFRWQIEDTNDPDLKYLIIPSSRMNSRVIDGQHRLRGFDFSISQRKFKLPCSIFLDLPLPLQASIFATININQKKVDRSLAYELFGYNLDQEPIESWSPEKLAIFLTRKLNVEADSPLRGNIKVVARFSNIHIANAKWTLSTSVFVDGICSLMSSNSLADRDILNMHPLKDRKRSLLKADKTPLRTFYIEQNDVLIYTILTNYFSAVKEIFFEKEEAGFIVRTVGVQALFDFLKLLIPKAIADKDITKEYFRGYLDNAKEINFNDKFFQSSGIGRSRIRNILILSSGIIEKQKLKIKDLKPYENLLKHIKSADIEERWIWEDEVEIALSNALSNAEWDKNNNTVTFYNQISDKEEVAGNNQELFERLVEYAEAVASGYMPSNAEELGLHYDGDEQVRQIMEEFKESIAAFGWS